MQSRCGKRHTLTADIGRAMQQRTTSIAIHIAVQMIHMGESAVGRADAVSAFGSSLLYYLC